MSDLLSLLQQGTNALGVYQAQSATATHNIQNADTPGYTRQRATLAASTVADRIAGAFIGRGVTLQGITQARDRFIERQLPQALGQSAFSSAAASALQSVTALNPDGALTEAMGSFYGALRAMAQNPSDLGLRQTVLGKASILAQAFQGASEGLTEARKGIDARVNGLMANINSLSEQMASLNRQVAMARSSGAPPNDLLDARQRVQDELVKMTGAKPVENADGTINLQLPQGPTLVSGDLASKLSTLPDPNNNGHYLIQYQGADKSPPSTLKGQAGGELGGLLNARDGAMKKALEGLDTLAFDLANALNAKHTQGYAIDGSTGREFFQIGSSAAGAASRIQVNIDITQDPRLIAAASSLTGLPGDASKLQEMVGTEQQALSMGTNASNALSSIITEFGITAQNIQSLASHDEATLNHLNNMRESVSGVSLDEEMINLTRAQRAYEAVTKVIQTTNEMLDTLMKLR